MTAPKTAAPTTTAKPKAKKVPLTEAQKAQRVADRKAEGADVRFRRVAKPRLAKAVAMLRRLETVGRSPAYEYTVDQANTVMKHIDAAVEKVRNAFVARVAGRAEDSISL
jgi:hypothetical protein